MSYTKTTWQNDQAPAINATNLNKIEQGIYDNDVNISGINETLGVDTNTWIGTTAYGEGDIVIYNDKIYQNISGTSTTTNPAEDTTNWDEITIFDTDSINDDLIDKTKFINNSSTSSGVETYSCNYINSMIVSNWDNNNKRGYIKYPDGTAICYGLYNPANGIGVNANSGISVEISLPITLSNTLYSINLTKYAGGNGFSFIEENANNPAVNKFYISLWNNNGSGTCYVMGYYWQVVGRWE